MDWEELIAAIQADVEASKRITKISGLQYEEEQQREKLKERVQDMLDDLAEKGDDEFVDEATALVERLLDDADLRR